MRKRCLVCNGKVVRVYGEETSSQKIMDQFIDRKEKIKTKMESIIDYLKNAKIQDEWRDFVAATKNLSRLVKMYDEKYELIDGDYHEIIE